ncbi:MAG: CHAT domain-containing protein [Caldilineaceae bacterium]
MKLVSSLLDEANYRNLDEQKAKLVGYELFNLLFEGRKLLVLQQSLAKVRSNKQGLRVCLQMNDVPELERIAWELLYDAENQEFLALSQDVSFVRYSPLPSNNTQVIDKVLRILAIIPTSDVTGLESEKEWKDLLNVFNNLIKLGRVELTRIQPARLSELKLELEKQPCHIIHFSGHCVLEQLCFDEERVTSQTLSEILERHNSIRLVFLNTAQSSTIAKALTVKGIPAVIAWSSNVSDKKAVALSQSFYSLIAQGVSIDLAFEQSRLRINQLYRATKDWSLPVLYTSTEQSLNLLLQEPPKSPNPSVRSTRSQSELEDFQVLKVVPTDAKSITQTLPTDRLLDLTRDQSRERLNRGTPRYTPTYRQKEIRVICDSVLKGESLCFVGVAGLGKSNITNFLHSDPYSYKPAYLGDEAGHIHFPVCDGHTWNETPEGLWQMMLAALVETTAHIEAPELDSKRVLVYEDQKTYSDLRQRIRWLCKEQNQRIMFILDDFDDVISTGPLSMLEQLNALRTDGNSGSLSYLIFTKRLPHVLGQAHSLQRNSKFYHLFSQQIYTLEPYDDGDARQMLEHLTQSAGRPLHSQDLIKILMLGGGHARLLKIVFELWRANPPDAGDYVTYLFDKPDVQNECMRIFASLHDEEQQVAIRIAKGQETPIDRPIIDHLIRRGLLENRGKWIWFSPLFEQFLQTDKSR